MKNKYWNRAKEILWSKYPIWLEPELYQQSQMEAMCKLAEEVEISTVLTEKFKKVGKMDGIYLKEEVEELLQKQKELFEDKVLNILSIHEIPNIDEITTSIYNTKLKID